jgi:hypothetical protein
MQYLTFIDPFTEAMFMMVFIIMLMVAMVYWLAKAFAMFLNQVFDLKKPEYTRKNYDDFSD